MIDNKNVVYTAKARTAGGREGVSHSSDGRLHVKLSRPNSLRAGTNPEQLFAAGWSACYISAMGLAAHAQKVVLPPDLTVDAEVDLCAVDGAYFVQARLMISLPGLERSVAQALVDATDEICPYSKATRGNIDVAVTLV